VKRIGLILCIGLGLAVVGVMAFVFPTAKAQEGGGSRISNEALARLSQGPVIRYLQAHPDQAPEEVGVRLQALDQAAQQSAAQAARQPAALPPPAGVGTLFNRDDLGLPQNEESITACRSNPDVVLGGTNDLRGLVDPQGNITGWHVSTNGGRSLANEGLLPTLTIGTREVPSGGDPVDVADDECNLYAGSLNYDPEDPFNNPNGIGVYKSDPETLANCPGGSDPSCWPTRRIVAVNRPGHFLDKEWIYVGRSSGEQNAEGGGEAGTVVWIVYTDFVIDETAPLGFTSASIKAVRCSADLQRCTAPIRISGTDQDVQFADVTIGPDGRTYITWTQIQGELEQQPQTFTHKLRVAEPGSTTFGPTHVVATEELAIPFGGFLNANDFRIATYPKNEVRIIDGKPRVYVVWDACRARLLDGTVCEEPVIKLTASDDLGESWSDVKILSKGGPNYFPTISNDREGPHLAVAYFTNRFDQRFDNRQDVELVTLNPETLGTVDRQRLTSLSNEPEADPVLGGFFIGDYIEVFALQNRALVHYNANYRQIQLLGEGLPVPQQDNYLRRASLRR
jgi:hypothetical protein